MRRYMVIRGDGSEVIVEAARAEDDSARNGVNFYDEEGDLVAKFTGLQAFYPEPE